MRPFKQNTLILVLVVLVMPLWLLGANRLAVSVDPGLGAQILKAANTAEQEGNWNGALREYRRWLELYPNEPLMQAPVYLAMGAAAQKNGDSAQAKEYSRIARTLDPKIDSHIGKAESSSVTRGKADTALSIMTAVMGAIQTARAARAQQQQYSPPPQYNQPPGGGYGYPAAPVGDPGYAPPANGYAPMPGYGAPPNSGYAPAPNYGQAPGQQPGGYAPPSGQQPGYAPPPGQPNPNSYGAGAPPAGAPPYGGYPPAQPYGQQPPGPQAAPGQYQQQPQGQYGYAPPPDPYGAPNNYQRRRGAMRGAAAPPPIKVIHDHSQVGDKDYFEKGCGALLAVDGGNLTFTPSGGEAPQVIPATQIREIRLNTTVGRNIGAFHVVTKKGLYLNLAPASGNRDEGRADVETLRKELGLADQI